MDKLFVLRADDARNSSPIPDNRLCFFTNGTLFAEVFPFIVRADLASGRDFHLAAEKAEPSDFEFYCIFEQIGARAEWSQAKHLGHVTLGCVR